MYNPKHFEQGDLSVVSALIAHFPLGALVTTQSGSLEADHIPFLLEGDLASGAKLIGHVAKNNPVWQRACADAECMVIFQGPSAYISPNWYPSKQVHHEVVPTYNYAVAHVYGKLTVSHDPQTKLEVVDRLTAMMEAGSKAPWGVLDAPASYIENRLKEIVAIELLVTRVQAKWKISQNREDRDRLGAAKGLASEASSPTAAHMARMVEAKTGIGQP
jgi:transcriptional regulator